MILNKSNFIDVINVMDFNIGRLTWIISWVQPNELLKAETFLWQSQRGVVEGAVKYLKHEDCWHKDESYMSKNRDLSHYSHKQLDSANKPE